MFALSWCYNYIVDTVYTPLVYNLPGYFEYFGNNLFVQKVLFYVLEYIFILFI